MKKVGVAISAILYVLVFTAAAQDKTERRIIEVTGSAEQLVTPDEFTFKITLSERLENKQKITIDQLEAGLRNELATLGVDVTKDLSIFDISSMYFRQKKVKDVLSTKDYRLKLRDLNKIARLQEVADRLGVSKLDLIDTEHSEIVRLRRETKTAAIKAAREKAEYLLGAINERVGKPVHVREIEESARFMIDGASGASNTVAVSNIRRTSVDPGTDNDLSFSQIRIRYLIEAKFEIE